MSEFVVYVLRSLKDGKHYTGSTGDLRRRLQEHARGHTQTTRRRGPFELVYTEKYGTLEEARAREKQLKSGKGREELKRILGSIEADEDKPSCGGPPAAGGFNPPGASRRVGKWGERESGEVRKRESGEVGKRESGEFVRAGNVWQWLR
jgi:putative endonuclease